MDRKLFRIRSARISFFAVVAFFAALSYLIDYSAKSQKAADKLKASQKVEYLLNKVEKFDFIIGKQKFSSHH